MMEEIVKKTQDRMTKALEVFRNELSSIRTGRASTALVDNIQVEYYGSMVPLKQLASLSTPEPKQILIQPFDKNAISAIDKALQKADLGAMPKIDGTVIRIILPPMTEERRKDLVKNVKKHAEDTKVAIRNIRRDAIDEVKKQKEAKKITEDQAKHLDTEIQKVTDKEIAEVDKLVSLKEKEIMEV